MRFIEKLVDNLFLLGVYIPTYIVHCLLTNVNEEP
jgi:hypothetical protein